LVNDIISDGLTRIRNAIMRRQEITKLLYSGTMENILVILQEKGYLDSFKVVEEGSRKFINVVLRYNDDGKTVVSEIVRISKPGRRIYKGYKDLKRFKSGYGIIIVSTSKGLMPNEEAFKQKVGGEVLCSIW
jgi:small subunit ribosomal protein S8